MNNQSAIEARRKKTDQGYITQLTRDGKSASVFNSTALANDPNFGPIINPVDAAYAAMIESVAEYHRNGHIGNALNVEIERRFSQFQPILLNAIQSVKERRANLSVRKARAVEFSRDLEPNSSLRSDYRKFYQSHSLPERIQIALNSDHALAASIFEGGQAMSGLSEEIWQQFTNHWMALNHIKRTGSDVDFTIQSSPEFITGAGVNNDAAYRAAVAMVNDFDRESEVLDIAESYFKSMVAALVMLTNKSASKIIGLGD